MNTIQEKRPTTEREVAIWDLQQFLKPGDTVYTIVRHVAKSGMSRVIDLYVLQGGEMRRISWTAAKALGWRYDKNHEGIFTSGCGMDMCFHMVYTLGRVLFPNGFKLPEGTMGRNGDTSGKDADGGYALNHRSL